MSAWLTWLKEIGCAGAGQLQEHSPWGAAQQAQSGACHPPWRACHLLWQSDRTPCKQRLPHRRHVRAKHSAPRRQGLQQALQSHVHAPPSMAESVDCRYGSLCCLCRCRCCRRCLLPPPTAVCRCGRARAALPLSLFCRYSASFPDRLSSQPGEQLLPALCEAPAACIWRLRANASERAVAGAACCDSCARGACGPLMAP